MSGIPDRSGKHEVRVTWSNIHYVCPTKRAPCLKHLVVFYSLSATKIHALSIMTLPSCCVGRSRHRSQPLHLCCGSSDGFKSGPRESERETTALAAALNVPRQSQLQNMTEALTSMPIVDCDLNRCVGLRAVAQDWRLLLPTQSPATDWRPIHATVSAFEDNRAPGASDTTHNAQAFDYLDTIRLQ